MGLHRNSNVQHNKVLLYIVACFLCSSCAIEINKEDDDKSVSYFDFLSDVRMKIHQANDFKQVKVVDDLSNNVQRLYVSMAKYLTDTDDDTGNKERASNVSDVFLDSMANKNVVSSACINDTGRLITSLLSREPWAVQFFDATGKPGPSLTQFRLNFVGNYDQCRDTIAPPVASQRRKSGGFKGNYCVVTVTTNVPIIVPTIGACVPSTCSSEDISFLMLDILKDVRIGNMTFEGVGTECLTGETEVTTATVISILILSIVVVMMILGTAFDILSMKETEREQANPAQDLHHQQHGYGNNRVEGNGETTYLLPNSKTPVVHSGDSPSLMSKVLLAFSVYSNGKKVLNASQPPGSLGAIHGIRFLSMSWVVLCHVYGEVISVSLNAIVEYTPLLNRWTFLPIANGFVSVDTFFTLSGLLTSYLTMKEMMKRKSWKINWPMFYFHRFWRLTPPYMFTLVIVLGLQQYLGQGPLWKNEQPQDKSFCEKNWWTNLLYVNNLVRVDEECFGVSWYLANDMQFFVVSPLMLIPFYFHRLAGVLSCCVFLLATWITTGVLSTTNDWSTTMVSLKPSPEAMDWFKNYYIVPWCRIGPFIIGIMAGYVLAMSKGRPFRMRWWVVALGWIISVCSGLAVVYGIRGDVTGDDVSSTGAASFYNLINRSVWGACVSWVIIACSAGYGGPVNRLLSWSPFVVLGRLTYMSYLIHICLLAVFFENMDSLIALNDTTFVILFLGFLLFVNMVSFVFVLALESPMVGLEKSLLRKERK